MQVTLNAGTPAETRLIAAFLNDLADLQEAGSAVPAVVAKTVDAGKVEETKTMTRGKKVTKETAEPETTPVKSETTTTTTTEPEATKPKDEPANNSTQETAPVTHDDLRQIFGALSQNGKGDLAIAELGKLGFKSIKSIPVDELPKALKILKGL